MSAPLRVGIIGCGQISQHHMKTYAGLSGVEMVAFCDANEEAAARASADFGPGTVYTDFREVLKRDDIDAVDVCLHNNLHSPVTIEALEAGKHVYCEKPMAGSYADALAMKKAADATGKKLHIQLSTLYSAETRASRELIEAGKLGEVFHARSAGFRCRGRPYVDGYGTPSFVQKSHASGGALYDMGVYHISRALYLLGNPKVERISGKTYQKTPMDAKRREISGYDVEELGVGFVRLDGDRSLEIIESWAAYLDGFGGSWLLGSEGGIRLDPFGYFTSIGDLSLDATVNLGEAQYRWTNVKGDFHLYESSQAHWLAAHRGEVDLIPTDEIALTTMLISEGIYLSQKLGREVTPQEVEANSVSTARQV
ncbi:MAG: Gfo/Idh/MocA family oxidoreductase [Fimbriimonadaceae bacterium]|nr:Gfo/Idh/MocA family oxidoreductase [Fimbriimonadaceae bacterium]